MIDALNRDCFCSTLDQARLQPLLDDVPPNLFAELPVFVSRAQVDAMARVIAAV